MGEAAKRFGRERRAPQIAKAARIGAARLSLTVAEPAPLLAALGVAVAEPAHRGGDGEGGRARPIAERAARLGVVEEHAHG